MDDRTLAVAFMVLAIVVALYGNKPRGKALPGPPGIPIIGNILPLEQPWKAIHEYSKLYGKSTRHVLRFCMMLI